MPDTRPPATTPAGPEDTSPWRLTSTTVLFDMVDDPRAGHGLLGVSDPDVHLVDGRWTMVLGAFTTRFVVRVVEARLPPGDPVDSDRWELVTDARGRAVEHGAPPGRGAWDAAGMHTPCVVVGTVQGRQVERLYYAGRGTSARTGPRSRYAIGVLERGEGEWHRYGPPVLTGSDDRPSVLEPRVVHHEGRWQMWFLATTGEVGRGEQPNYELRYTESADGLTWDTPERFAGVDEGFFDVAVRPGVGGSAMVLARGTNLYGTQPFPSQGLWWMQSEGPPGGREVWGAPRRLLETDRLTEPWLGAGVCGPSFVEQIGPDGRAVLHVFATGTRSRTTWGREALRRLRRGRRPPPPSPYYLATGRLTFTAS